MKIKKTLMMALASCLMATGFCGDAFTFVNSDDGYSYIQFNQDLDSFSFKSDWHSLGNAGRVGYVVYSADMSESARAAYMEANANNPQFGKHINDGVVEIKNLKAGDAVGFYEVRPNGGTYTSSSFKDWKDDKWLAFDKNGGHGKDEWMTIADITVQEAGGGSSGGSGSGGGAGAPNGAPLPGALAVLLVGAVGAGAFKAGKKH